MIRPAVLLALLVWGSAAGARGLDLTDAERAVFGAEVRAAILSFPEVVDRVVNPPAPSLYADAVEADLNRISEDPTLFGPTPRGIGAETPRLTIVFFEDFPCTGCAAAWADLRTLVSGHPDIRVEPRFARESGAAQLLLSLLAHQGPAVYAEAHERLLGAETEDDLQAVLRDGKWAQDRMLRAEPAADAAAFQRLELQEAPAYVFPDKMLQGAMPLIVLEKYVAE